MRITRFECVAARRSIAFRPIIVVMLRRRVLLCRPPASCVASLSVPLADARFWRESAWARAHGSLPVEVTAAALATLECLVPERVGAVDVALCAMRRWTELDGDDAVTELLASSAAARRNLAAAIASHYASVEFVNGGSPSLLPSFFHSRVSPLRRCSCC